jgi:hypothetical protein
MKTLETNVRVPTCWKRLINEVFPEDLAGITSEKHLKGVDDLESHYDDCRVICGSFENGTTFQLQLCSGQGNYWGSLVMDGPDDLPIIEDEVLESWTDGPENTLTLDDGKGVQYVIHIEWYGEDPYAQKA